MAILFLVPIGMLLASDAPSNAAMILWAALMLLALSVTLMGCFTTRFEMAGSANPEGCIAAERARVRVGNGC